MADKNTPKGFLSRAKYIRLVARGAESIGAAPKDRAPLIDRQRREAGFPTIGEKGEINILGMIRFLFRKIRANLAKPKAGDLETAGISHRDKVGFRAREMSSQLAEIKHLPPVADPERRAHAATDLKTWFDTYLSESYFYRPYSDSQLKIIGRVERVCWSGGKYALSAKRRGAKTTIVQAAQLESLMNGRHVYQFFLAATEKKAGEAQEFFMNELENNELLIADYPEICYPIYKRQGKQQRSLTYHARPLKIYIGTEMIRLGMIEETQTVGGVETLVPYPSSGNQILFKSANSGDIRGSRHIIRNRGVYRPSLVVADDIQNDGSARSEIKKDTYISLFRKTLGQIGGYDKATGRIMIPSLFVIGTCIFPDDFQCRMVNRELNPDYQGEVFRRMIGMPENMKIWMKYRDIRAESLRKFGDNREGTAFYRQNREEMDRGARADDENDYEEGQISATQYAMDCWCDDEPAFWCEHQNQPEKAVAISDGLITPDTVIDCADPRYPQWSLPSETVLLTAHVDVGLNCLWYVVMAWGKNFSFGHVVAFGTFPEQVRARYRKNDIAKGDLSIQHVYEDRFAEEEEETATRSREYSKNQKDKVRRAVADCIDFIFSHPFHTVDPEGNLQEIDVHAESSFDRDNTNGRYIGDGKVLGKYPFLAKCSVDCADGMLEDTIWNALLDSPWKNRLIASYGGRSTTKMLASNIAERKPGERYGYHMIENPPDKKEKRRLSKEIVSVRYDVHVFKDETFAGWNTPEGMQGRYGISAAGVTKERLQLFAEHQASSQRPERRYVGTTRYNVYMETDIADDDWFDGVAANRFDAAYCGIGVEATRLAIRKQVISKIVVARTTGHDTARCFLGGTRRGCQAG